MGRSHADEQAALLTLLRSPDGRSWPQMAAEVSLAGSAIEVWREWIGADSLLPELDEDTAFADARAELASWHERGLRLITILDQDYPRRLLDIRETPPLLFVQGQLRAEDQGMSVVGSRKASDRGLRMATDVAQLLVRKNLTVISGLAAGIDAAAHRAALTAGGRTVAFIGTGITKTYPAANARLQAEIGERGLLLSQFLPDTLPTRHSFPMRNAVMSGYGLATIVIEAGETSGARIQARLAVEHGRPVILTATVVASTHWGRMLAERPGVHVVQDPADLEQVIDIIAGEPRQLEAALHELSVGCADPAA